MATGVMITAHSEPSRMHPVHLEPFIAPGTLVGEYRIEGLLGQGGMGTVYAATHAVIAKPVAIKVLRAAFAHNEQALERFTLEARAVNQIGHPNIIDIFSFGALPDGRPYYVMARLVGESLAERIAQGPMDLVQAVRVMSGICSALTAVHAQRIVHRDLKPDNIFLVDGVSAIGVKLLDFGIAKLQHDASRVSLTDAGAIVGTPSYMAPEQARDQGVGPAADVYALGVILFEMLSGRAPFRGESPMDTIAMHLTDEPPRLSQHASVPAELDTLVAAMLAKVPAERPDLEAVLRGCTRALIARPLRKRRPVLAVPIGLACFALMFGACWGFGGR